VPLHFSHPWLLVAFPLAALLLYLFERWRRRPQRVVVADLELFQPTPAAEEEARSQRRRLAWRFWLRLAAAALLCLALADLRARVGPPGALEVDLVLERGVASSAKDANGRSRLDHYREQLAWVLDALRPDDRVRVHALPGPPAPSLLRDEARAELARITPGGGSARPESALRPLVARARAGGPPVFFAGDREPEGLGGPGLAVALLGGPVRDRALEGLAAEAGRLHVTLRSRRSPGLVTVSVVARRVGGELVRQRLGGRLPPTGALRLSWDSLPQDSVEVSALLERRAGDDVPGNDRAFAVRPPVPPRRVGVIGEASEALVRALQAAPRLVLERLSTTPPDTASLDLLVLPALPQVIPRVAVAVVPTELGAPAVPGGPLVVQAGPLRHTRAQLGRDPAAVGRVGPTPKGLPQAKAVILAGKEPLVLLSGRGRGLLAVFRAPLDARSGSWVASASFPVFWAEFLELAAPRVGAELVAHPAGDPHPLLSTPPWEVKRYVDPEGSALVGTGARALRPDPPPVSRSFASQDLVALQATRAPSPTRPLAPALALLALLLVLAAWWPARAERP
jgi:hypothetical protein